MRAEWVPAHSACPWCGRAQEAMTADDGEPWDAPRDGDVSICLYCAKPALFIGRGLLKRRPSDRELAEILTDPGVARAVTATLDALDRARRG